MSSKRISKHTTTETSIAKSKSDNCENHLHLVEKDLLEFTNRLSRKIGSRRKNVLSALLLATTDITVPTFEAAEEGQCDPIRACLCELKGKNEESLIICEKNCCCLIFLEPCQCGIEVSAQVVINFANDHRDGVAARKTKGTGSGSRSSIKSKLRATPPYRSIENTIQQCSHGPLKRTAAHRKSSHRQPSRITVKNGNEKRQTDHSTCCRVVKLTEREYLILSRAEKSHKSFTKLSKSTRKKHSVQIFLMKGLREIHMRGGNYHQGLQELLKEIKRATEWWEHSRDSNRSKVNHFMSIAYYAQSTGEENTAKAHDGPFSLSLASAKSETGGIGGLAKSSALNHLKDDLENNGTKSPTLVPSPFLPIRRAKACAIQQIRQTANSMYDSEQKLKAKTNTAGSTDRKRHETIYRTSFATIMDHATNMGIKNYLQMTPDEPNLRLGMAAEQKRVKTETSVKSLSTAAGLPQTPKRVRKKKKLSQAWKPQNLRANGLAASTFPIWEPQQIQPERLAAPSVPVWQEQQVNGNFPPPLHVWETRQAPSGEHSPLPVTVWKTRQAALQELSLPPVPAWQTKEVPLEECSAPPVTVWEKQQAPSKGTSPPPVPVWETKEAPYEELSHVPVPVWETRQESSGEHSPTPVPVWETRQEPPSEHPPPPFPQWETRQAPSGEHSLLPVPVWEPQQSTSNSILPLRAPVWETWQVPSNGPPPVQSWEPQKAISNGLLQPPVLVMELQQVPSAWLLPQSILMWEQQ